MSASGALEMTGLLAVETETVSVSLGSQGERRDIGTGTGFGERERRDRLAGADAGDPFVDDPGTAGGEDRVRAEALERERGLGVVAEAREPLPHQAQLERRDLSFAPQHERDQAVRGERADQGPVDRTWFPDWPRSEPGRRERASRSAPGVPAARRTDARQVALTG